MKNIYSDDANEEKITYTISEFKFLKNQSQFFTMCIRAVPDTKVNERLHSYVSKSEERK